MTTAVTSPETAPASAGSATELRPFPPTMLSSGYPGRIAQPGDSVRLLGLAESLQRDAEELSNKINQLFYRYALSVAFVLGGYAVFFRSAYPEAPFERFVIFFVGVAVLGAAGGVWLVALLRSARKRLAVSRRSLREVLSLLRESEPTLAIEERWTSLQKAEFRIRLARFDIDAAG